MINLLSAIIKYCQQNSTFRDFVGSFVSGNTECLGPFLGVAPEGVDFPYITYDVIPNTIDQGFGGVASDYTEKPVIRFNLYDDDSDRLADNLTTFVNDMDVIDETDFDPNLDDGQTCDGVLRTQNPGFIAEPISKKGGRVYHAFIQYTFQNHRNKSVGE